MERNFLGSEGRAGVIMAYREWGGCCRNPGGVPSAGLRRDKIWGAKSGSGGEGKDGRSECVGAASTNHRSVVFLITPFHQAKTQPNGWAVAWWKGVDSNHRSRRQQIYSLLPLATREPFRMCSAAARGGGGCVSRFTPGTRWMELVNGIEPSTC